jgi:hypothetical protein
MGGSWARSTGECSWSLWCGVFCVSRWRLVYSGSLPLGFVGGLHVSAVLRRGLGKVLPIAPEGASRYPLWQLGIPRDSETAMLSDHHVVGVAREYCVGSVDGSEDDSGL